ncbi:amidase family protein [Bradyrhizobium sp. CCBAU 53380]|uniref:amidase family protein n=1 Tax=Bradyrhizobium sp. CCBAU 53380 TaxID=1325117 RepID=UPI00230423E9|nr:amidase family protein [Bradyrhizobium sp. CCBAU 53380]
MSSVSGSLPSDEFAYLTAHELAARIRRRDLSPVEVVDAFIQRIEARNPSLNALVYLDFDGARMRAKEAERALVAGESWGPFHGIPSALKDLFDFKPGWPASLGGIRALKNHVVNGYCMFCERMERRGGAVFLGKTNSPLMGFRGTCDNYLFGPTRNPFNLAKNTGGSSGGSSSTRSIGKHSMILNDALPHMEVDPETYEVRADGRLLTCPPVNVVPMAQRYFMY